VKRRPGWTAETRSLVRGTAAGEALVLEEPLSFWGGVDPRSGSIIEARHPQHGVSVGGRVLVMPAGRGSSSSSSVLAEAIRRRTGPLAILLAEPDEIVVIGVLVVQLLGGPTCPVAVLDEADYRRIRSGDVVRIRPGGQLLVEPRSAPAT
jgi:uncharacterized protein